jgi:hypothetical protein
MPSYILGLTRRAAQDDIKDPQNRGEHQLRHWKPEYEHTKLVSRAILLTAY